MSSNNKRGLAALMVSVSLLGAAHSQSWQRQAPLPFPAQNIPGVSFADTQRGYIWGSRPDVLETTDGGDSWHPRSFGGATINHVHFVDPLHGWSVGGGALAARRTVDGGVNWMPMAGLPPGTWYGVHFLTTQFGWAIGNGPGAVTQDGGVTWQLQMAPEWIQRISFESPSVGVGAGSSGFWRTTNGGNSWQLTQATSSARIALWLSPQTVVAISGQAIYRSTNSGASWTTVGPALTTGRSIVQVSANTIILPSFNDYLRSSDGGSTWSTMTIANANPIYRMIADSGITFALTVDGDIFASYDDAQTWQQAFDGPELPLWEMAFVNATTAFAVGNNGLVIKTDDLGLTWDYASNGLAATLTDLQVWDQDHAIAVAKFGLVVATSDGGQRWQPSRPVVANGGVDLDAVSTLPGGFAVAVGFGPSLVKTTDYGVTWSGMTTPGFQGIGRMNDVKFVSPNEGWIVGGGNAFILHTQDGGATWASEWPFTPHAFSGVDFTDSQVGYACGPADFIVRTTNGGATWTQTIIPSPLPAARLDIRFASSQVGWICGGFGYISKTVDGGATWSVQTTNSQRTLHSIYPIDEQEAWVAGGFGTLLHTTNGGATWTQETFSVPGTGQMDFEGVSGHPNGGLWLSATDGTILHHEPTARFTAFGNGCNGAAGAPVLAAQAGSVPTLGTSMAMQFSMLPAGGPPMIGVLGLSREAWGGVPLPLDLASIGMPNCTLDVRPDSTPWLTTSAGTAQWSLPIPNAPSLAGQSLFAQGFVMDLAANAFGATTSNAAELVLGF